MAVDPYAAPPVGPSRGTNTLAIVSLVCGLLSFFGCCLGDYGLFVSIGLGILAAILAYVALGQIRRTGEKGRELATAGGIIGGVVAALSVLLAVLALAGLFALGQWLERQQGLQPGIQGPLDPGGELGEPGEAAPIEPEAPVVPEPAGE